MRIIYNKNTSRHNSNHSLEQLPFLLQDSWISHYVVTCQKTINHILVWCCQSTFPLLLALVSYVSRILSSTLSLSQSIDDRAFGTFFSVFPLFPDIPQVTLMVIDRPAFMHLCIRTINLLTPRKECHNSIRINHILVWLSFF